MEFSFLIFGFKLTPKEALELAHHLSDFFHKEKNSICALLNFSNEFLEGWYDEVNNAYTPIIDQGSFKTLAEGERRVILKFISGPECADSRYGGFRVSETDKRMGGSQSN